MQPRPVADFRERVAPRDLPELMDGDCSYEDFRDCLVSLEQVNRWLLGYRPTLAWLGRLPLTSHDAVHIVDVGCGGGDLLRQIARWAKKRGMTVRLTGIDLNPYATRAAKEFTATETEMTWVTGDALLYESDRPIGIIVTSLMTHHLEEAELIALLRWMDSTAQVGWFINDLERSKWSSQMFGWMAKLVGWHRFVRHDGPVSFRRALSKADWERLLQTAGVERSGVSIEAWRPGRLCVGTLPRC